MSPIIENLLALADVTLFQLHHPKQRDGESILEVNGLTDQKLQQLQIAINFSASKYDPKVRVIHMDLKKRKASTTPFATAPVAASPK